MNRQQLQLLHRSGIIPVNKKTGQSMSLQQIQRKTKLKNLYDVKKLLLYLYFTQHDSHRKPTNRYLSLCLNRSTRQIRRDLAMLEQKGALKRTYIHYSGPQILQGKYIWQRKFVKCFTYRYLSSPYLPKQRKYASLSSQEWNRAMRVMMDACPFQPQTVQQISSVTSCKGIIIDGLIYAVDRDGQRYGPITKFFEGEHRLDDHQVLHAGRYDGKTIIYVQQDPVNSRKCKTK